jgi:hypothetical protein
MKIIPSIANKKYFISLWLLVFELRRKQKFDSVKNRYVLNIDLFFENISESLK